MIERDARANGASIRNFGFITVSGQERGDSWRLARRTRDIWAELTPAAVRTRGGRGPWFYTVEAGKRLSDRLPLEADYDFEVQGPNGFLREFRDAVPITAISAECRYDSAKAELVIAIRNQTRETREFVVSALRYAAESPRRHRLGPGEAIEDRRAISASSHWYDITLRSGNLLRRWAGHVETGRDSHSDPALGA